MNVEDQVLKSKIAVNRIGENTAFLASLLFQTPIHINEQIPTACTNGLNIQVNPDFFMSLNEEEQKFLLLHEVLHMAYLHMARLDNRNPKKWNYATDYVINLFLKDELRLKMPKGALYAKKFKGKSSEEVYELLPNGIEFDEDLMDLIPSNDGDISGDTIGDSTTASVNTQRLEQEMKSRIKQAQIMAKQKGFGKLPNDLERFLTDLLEPKIHWATLLKRFMNQVCKNDYSWRKPNRRHFPEYYLPSLHSEQLGKITFAVDTSGSIDDKQFQQFVSEVVHVLKFIKPSEIDFIQFDHEIQSRHLIKNLADLDKVKFTGGGGTCLKQVFTAFNQSDSRVMIVLTDGHFDQHYLKTNKPVIWAIYGNKSFTSNIGRAVHVEL